MAPPSNFKPKPLDLHAAFALDLEQARQDHSEALLNLYALLQEAQDHGWLDAARGTIAGAHIAVAEAAKYANTPEGIAMMRNLVSLGKILAAIDPEVLHALSVGIANNSKKNAPDRAQTRSLWKLFRQVLTPDVLRGAAFTLGIVALLGKALASPKRRATG